MNCQDIARILDEQEVESLLAAERSDVQAHLAICSDCARDWQIHVQLGQAEIPAVPAELRALYATQVAGVADMGARRRSRLIVIGTLIAVAAAAAMLGTQLHESPKPVAAVIESPQAESAAAFVTTQELPLAATDVRVGDAEQPARKVEQTPVAASANSAQLTIVLLPPRFDSEDKAARPAIEAYHSSLLHALRSIPDVAVEVAAPANDKPANRVTVVSPQVTILTSGQRMYRSGSGNGTWSGGPPSGPPPWAVEVLVEAANKSGSSGSTGAGTLAIHFLVDGTGVPTRDTCSFAGPLLGAIMGKGDSAAAAAALKAVMSMCFSTDQLAVRLVEALRQKPEPPVTDTAPLATQLRDTAIPAADRQRVLSELVRRSRAGEITLDAATVDAITAYINSLPPDQRPQRLLSLRNLRQPALVTPLLDWLQHDGDEKMRLEALATLAADYSSDSRVLAALESVARQDASRLVRMVAQRPLSGDAPWQAFVVETLANKGLPVTQRLEPVIYSMRSVTSPDAIERTRAFLGSAEVTSQLLDIFHELQAGVRATKAQGMRDMQSQDEAMRSMRSQDDTMRNVLSLLSTANASVALNLQISILEDPVPGLAPFSSITTQALMTLVGRRDDPRVSKLLDDIAAGKKGPELRNQLEMQMVETQQMSTRPPDGRASPGI